MTGVLKSVVHKEEDMVLKDTGEIIIALEGCDKANVKQIEDRLRQALEAYLFQENIIGKIKLKVGTTTYPDDGREPGELIRKAKS
jgi:GGDEF domain-containing protein